MGQHATKPEEKSTSHHAGGHDGGYTFEVKDLADSQKQLIVKVSEHRFGHMLDHAYAELAPKVEIPGFRPGKAPRNLVEAKLGARLFEEAIKMTLPEVTADIINELALNPMDYAKYNVQKVSKDGMEYTATFTVMPEIKLPSFKGLKVKQEKVEVADKEVEESMKRLFESIKEKDKAKINWAKELNDKELKTEADVRKRIKSVMEDRRKAEAEEKFVNDLITAAIEKAGIKVPKPLVEAEVIMMEKQYSDRIEKLGLKVEDFLKTQKTDLETMRKTWAKDAEYKIAADFLFVAIAKMHEVKIEVADIDAEIAKVADEKVRADYETPNGRNYISAVLIRQRSLAKLKEMAGIK